MGAGINSEAYTVSWWRPMFWVSFNVLTGTSGLETSPRSYTVRRLVKKGSFAAGPRGC